MSEWQPIETAPKDMRPILVFVRANREPIQEEPDTIHVAFLKRPGTYALQDDDHSLIDPTHWMPLPSPPTPTADGRGKVSGMSAQQAADFARRVAEAECDNPDGDLARMSRIYKTTDDTVEHLRAEIARLTAVLDSARAALIECANIIRPQFQSFSDNVIGAHLNEINGVIGNPIKRTSGEPGL